MTLTTLRTHRTRLKMRRVAVGAAGSCQRGEGGGVARAAKEVVLPALRRGGVARAGIICV